ncbi:MULTISPECIES: hypothetical protein [Clostridia]|nr:MULTISPECIES: hypothetical protein [Clostridia]MCH1937917.1 hypothetical protein [Enterocloster sp. OA11]
MGQGYGREQIIVVGQIIWNKQGDTAEPVRKMVGVADFNLLKMNRGKINS